MNIRRARITATLKTLSPLHIGSGDVESFRDRKDNLAVALTDADKHPRYGDESGLQALYATVCRDHNKRAYVPGTSLRGLLRALAGTKDGSRWFGPSSDIGAELNRGMVSVWDAPMTDQRPTATNWPDWTLNNCTIITQRVAIDPITGTAEAHKLFSLEAVPPDCAFTVTVEATAFESTEGNPARPLTTNDVSKLENLLLSINGSLDSALGADTNLGFGRVNAAIVKVEVISDESLKNWLYETADSPWTAHGTAHSATKLETGHLFTIEMQSPWAINDPAWQKPDGDPADGKHPAAAFSRDGNGRACIPASSLRGLLRARALRIANTIRPEPGKAKALIDALFGSTDKRGRIAVTNASSVEETIDPSDSAQTFNAIDRMTGGVADSKLYFARPAQTRKLQFRAELRDEPSPAERGLLLLLARDALEGDLAIGWGKARGFGALVITHDTVTKFADLWKLFSGAEGSISNGADDINALHAWLGANPNDT